MKIETTAVYCTCYSRRSIKLIVAFFQAACLREYVRVIEGDRIESMSAFDLPGWTPDPLECRRSCRRTDPFQRSDECHSPPRHAEFLAYLSCTPYFRDGSAASSKRACFFLFRFMWTLSRNIEIKGRRKSVFGREKNKNTGGYFGRNPVSRDYAVTNNDRFD